VTAPDASGPGDPQAPAGVVLAAGAGTRLRPLTDLRPKALCPVGGVPLVDLALARIAPVTGEGPDRLAVNAHHHADRLAAHLAGHVTVSVERPQALGTAGALAALRDWIAGRDVLLTNADAYLPAGIGRFAQGWDGRRCRLLCVRVPDDGIRANAHRADFYRADGAALRYVGVCLLPWTALTGLAKAPSGLYEVLWRSAAERAELDLVTLAEVGAGEVFIDCGTPQQYLGANLHAGGGRSVVGAGARVLGSVERCVVWDGAWVGPQERLVEVIRAGTREEPLTVDAAPAPAATTTSAPAPR
jgi:N-acetyl-alpha-D-muramate 1-phosphate uridylyltransferase